MRAPRSLRSHSMCAGTAYAYLVPFPFQSCSLFSSTDCDYGRVWAMPITHTGTHFLCFVTVRARARAFLILFVFAPFYIKSLSLTCGHRRKQFLRSRQFTQRTVLARRIPEALAIWLGLAPFWTLFCPLCAGANGCSVFCLFPRFEFCDRLVCAAIVAICGWV